MLRGSKTSGGKGNSGKFIERDHKICAAGITSSQPEASVASCLKYYSLQDEVDALLQDTIRHDEKPQSQSLLRRDKERDMRNAGPFNEIRTLINPPVKTKFQTLVDDFKETAYKSYWRKVIGQVPDPVPLLPKGFDILTTLGMKQPCRDRLYDLVMPKEPLVDKTPISRNPGQQTDRNYCKPAYNPNTTYGVKTNTGAKDVLVKRCLTYEDVVQGIKKKPINTKLAHFIETKHPQLAVPTTPNNNINSVPKGFTFGKLEPSSDDNLLQCLTMCKLNTKRELFKECLSYLNTLRIFLKKKFEKTFFKQLYLSLKYIDEEKSGWLVKNVIYKHFYENLIHINPHLMEPLLCLWNIFDGSFIEYESFVNIINFTKNLPELPNIRDIPKDCVELQTTYKEMVAPGHKADTRGMAGIPSGRYLDLDYQVTPDGYCRADRSYLVHESDVKACLSPSLFTLLGVSHRDMYCKQEPNVIKKVFKSAGQNIDEEKFQSIWNNAKKFHSEGWVCFETFRRSLNEIMFEEKNIIRQK